MVESRASRLGPGKGVGGSGGTKYCQSQKANAGTATGGPGSNYHLPVFLPCHTSSSKAKLCGLQANVSGSWARLKGFIAMHEKDLNPTGIPFHAQLKEARVCLDEGVISKALFDKVKIRLLRGSAAQVCPSSCQQ